MSHDIRYRVGGVEAMEAQENGSRSVHKGERGLKIKSTAPTTREIYAPVEREIFKSDLGNLGASIGEIRTP